MTVPVFVDSNVLIYARDASEPDKQPVAIEWLEHLWQERNGRLSHQVLAEFYVTVTRKLDPGLSRQQARADVRDLLAWRPLAVEGIVTEGAWVLEDRFGLSFWDALVVSAAQVSGCEVLLTEDLGHEDLYDGVRAINPFLVEPSSLHQS